MPPKTRKKAAKETVDRSRRRTVVGVVTADKMDKTIKVQVERFVQDPDFGKTLRKHYVCYAHDEKGEADRGDKVELMETRPISKLKHWRLLRVIAKGAAVATIQDAREAARPVRGGTEDASSGTRPQTSPAPEPVPPAPSA